MGGSFTFGAIHYEDVVYLDRDDHADMAIRPDLLTAVTEGLQASPLTVDEMEAACRSYLITFSNEDHPTPFAHISLSKERNPFLINGTWQPRSYVPNAILRFPFMLSRPMDDGQRRLLLDRSTLVSAEDAPERRLFQDDGESPFLMQMIKRTFHYQACMDRTRVFQRILSETGLLVTRPLFLPRPDKDPVDLGAVVVVDQERLAEAPTELIAELHTAGVLPAIYAHLISLRPFRVGSSTVH